MAIQRDQMSQTIRIDIPPDLLKKGKDGQTRQLVVSRQVRARPDHDARSDSGLAALDTDFQELFQRLYDGAMIADMTGKIVDVNVRLVEFLRFERTELQELRIMDVISGSDDSLLAMLRENLGKDLFTLIQAYCARKDGTLFPAEIAVNRLRLSQKEYLCFFIRDITVRRQGEEALRTTYRAIQNAGNGIGITSLDAIFEEVNPAVIELWGFARKEDLVGHSLGELLNDATVLDTIIAAVKEGKFWVGPTIGRRKDGSEFHLQISAAGNRDSDEELVGMVFSFTDISAARRAEEIALHAERQRVMMESLGTVCHHMGQPATVLLTSLDVIQKMVDSDANPATKELLGSSIEAAESLRDMLNELNSMAVYKTRPYLETKDNSPADDTMILDF